MPAILYYHLRNQLVNTGGGNVNGSVGGNGITTEATDVTSVANANDEPLTRRSKATMRNTDSIVFRVEETSDLPIWVQLRNRIAYLIRSGFFKPGEQLPSVRSLAAEAHINYNTVAKAYRDLELSDLIISIRGRGMFVQNSVTEDDAERLAIDALLENCIQQYRAAGMAYEEIREHTKSIINQLEQKAREAEEEKRDYGTV